MGQQSSKRKAFLVSHAPTLLLSPFEEPRRCRARHRLPRAQRTDIPQMTSQKGEKRMVPRQIKMPVKDSSEQELEEVLSHRKRPERGRFLLQVDRQTKGSYTTSEAAQAAALIIKKNYPIVKVSVYDSVDNSNTLVEAPAASS